MAGEVELQSVDSNLQPGIIYISKIPPFMKPGKVKSHMEQFGEIGRVFLQPEGLLIRYTISVSELLTRCYAIEEDSVVGKDFHQF